MMIQLDFFEKDEMSEMKVEIEKIRKSSDLVRKGLFAKHGGLEKMVREINERLEILEKNICKGEI